MASKKIVAKFGDESALLKAILALKAKEVSIVDAYGPFATHDILKHITKESRLPYMSVFYGTMAVILTFAFIYYTSVIDYPIVYSGKPPFSFPPMVVIMFLACILLTTILTVLTFHGRTFIFPGKPANIIAPTVTDDTFFLVVEKGENQDQLKNWLTQEGAEEITEKEF
jgi:hypothetical protein